MCSGYPSTSYVACSATESMLSSIKSYGEASHNNLMATQSPVQPRKYEEVFNPALQQPQFPITGNDGASSGITPSFNALQSGLSYNVLATNSPQRQGNPPFYKQQPIPNDVMMGLQPQQNYQSISLAAPPPFVQMPMDYHMQPPSRRTNSMMRQSGCNQETVQSQSDSPMTGVQMQQSPVLSS